MAGKNLVDGGKVNLGIHLREQGFVVGLRSLLAGQLEVALVPALQVAFQNVPGDLKRVRFGRWRWKCSANAIGVIGCRIGRPRKRWPDRCSVMGRSRRWWCACRRAAWKWWM